MLRYSLIYKKRERERAGAGGEWMRDFQHHEREQRHSERRSRLLSSPTAAQTNQEVYHTKKKLNKKKPPTNNWINSPFPKTQTKNIMTRDMQ